MAFDVDGLLGSLDRETFDDGPPRPRELVVEKRSGKVRQAGAASAEGAWIERTVRPGAERSLYYFAKAILDQFWLRKELHRDIARFLTTLPPVGTPLDAPGPKRRKMVIIPRHCGKTSLVGHGLPIHMIIQPEAQNLYVPGIAGTEMRILLAGESEERASDALGVIKSHLQSNDLIRALWPQVCWDNPRRDAEKWNNSEIVVPRARHYPDPTIRATGVGGVVTGAHPNAIIKDDLVTLKAANSIAVMQAGIDWHTSSRALTVGNPSALEWIIGTLWHVNDLYDHIKQTDPTVETYVRSIIEAGEIIYPKASKGTRSWGFTMKDLEILQKDMGPLFSLMYMNDPTDASVVDMNMRKLRTFSLLPEPNPTHVVYESHADDEAIIDLIDNAPAFDPDEDRGQPLTVDKHFEINERFDHRAEWFRGYRVT